MKSRLFNKNMLVTVALPVTTLLAGGYTLKLDSKRHEEYETNMLKQGFVKEPVKCQDTPLVVTPLGGGYRHEDRCTMWVKKTASGTVEVPYDTSYRNQKF